MELESWVCDLTLEMIPEGYRELATLVGLENFVKLTKYLGGQTVYIPKADSFLRPARDMNIKKEFNGHNHAALAKKYNLTVKWVEAICGPGDESIKGQMSIFDFDGAREAI